MSDIQEEQKRLYKRAKENDLKAKMKPLFPEDVEMICISKDDYDRLYGDLTYENIELQQEINRLNNIIDELEKYLKEQVFNKAGSSVDLAIENHSYCKVLDKLNELKGDNK